MPEPNGSPLEEKLRKLVETGDVANLLARPLISSINDLLQTSAADIDSDEASILVRDGEKGDLRFLTAIGEVADKLAGMKIPAGKGIAGFVFSSGQPMAVADVGEESSFYAEVDHRTGYSTQTMLATPLRLEGEVVGVLEYINRRGEPPYAPFTPAEMDKAALFADAIASLVGAHEGAKLLRELGDTVLAQGESFDIAEISNWLRDVRASTVHRETLELAVLLRELAWRGDAERALCRELLQSILKYSDSKNETSYLSD